MEEERSFSELPSDPPEAALSISPRAQKFSSIHWHEYFLKRYEQLLDDDIIATWRRCRVLVLSGTDLRDTYETDGEMNTVMSDGDLRNEDHYKVDKEKAEMLQNCFGTQYA